jgi:hypothetical protein
LQEYPAKLMTLSHFSLRTLLASACILLLSLIVASTTRAQETSFNPQFGMNNAYDSSVAALESGAGWEVITFRWDQLQPNGPTEWQVDSEIEDALRTARTANREVVGVLIGTPAWATAGNPVVGVPDMALWEAFVSRAVSYYASRGVNHWTIWADPDISRLAVGATWEGTTRDYYRLVKTAYTAAKQANPNAAVHLAGVSYYDPAWFGQFINEAINDSTAAENNYYFDVATIHAFGSVEAVYTQTGNHYFVMSQAAIPLKEVWINRANARPTEDPGTYPAGIVFRQYPNVTLEQQSAFIIQAYAMGFAAGAYRIAAYRLVDDLPADQGEAYGLLRADGSERPAYLAYQIAAREMSGYVFARRVDEEAGPLMEYVRLTSPDRVTHIVWARTEENATITIPSRSASARLLDSFGHEWILSPQAGAYKVAVEGASCNDPVYDCLIGGDPWILVEEGVDNPLDARPPSVSVARGGTIPTPAPTATPTATVTPTPEPSLTPIPSTATEPPPQPIAPPEISPTAEATAIAEAATPVVEAPPVEPTEERPLTQEEIDALTRQFTPRGIRAALPFVLIGLGLVSIGGGVWYLKRSGRKFGPGGDRTVEHERPDVDSYYADTTEHERPDLGEDEPSE